MWSGKLIQDFQDIIGVLEYYINDIVGDDMIEWVKEMKFKKIWYFEMQLIFFGWNNFLKLN